MKHRLLLLFAICSLLTGCGSSTKKYTVVVDNVEGLKEGSNVVCAGLPIGKVTHLDLFKDSVVVDIEINKDFNIPIGSKFIVENNAFGTTNLLVERSGELSFIKNHDTVRGYKDTSRFTLTGTDTARQRKVKESIQKIADGFKELIESSSKDSTKN